MKQTKEFYIRTWHGCTSQWGDIGLSEHSEKLNQIGTHGIFDGYCGHRITYQHYFDRFVNKHNLYYTIKQTTRDTGHGLACFTLTKTVITKTIITEDMQSEQPRQGLYADMFIA